MLAILDAAGFAGESPDGARYHHLLAEATRLAFEERNRTIGDPDHGDIAVDRFLDTARAAGFAATIGDLSRPAARAENRRPRRHRLCRGRSTGSGTPFR